MPAHRRRRGRGADRDASDEPAASGTPDAREGSSAGAERAAHDDQTLSETDQTLSETDQTLSDADQTLSDADQSAAEHDRRSSEADQRASDRDQAAANREQAGLPEGKLLEAFAGSRAERARATAERQAASELRSASIAERVAGAAERDENAALRDMQAAARDRTADLRDLASDEHERALGIAGGYPARARAKAADDRKRAAQDRARAAEDRKQAALDREHAQAELAKAQLDDLTGFYRLGLGRVVLEREISRSRRADGRFILAYCDVDGLKQVNDTRGHAEGDRLLRGVADLLRARFRAYDPIVRVGGDEFVVGLSATDIHQARAIFDEIRAGSASNGGASISFGLAALQPDDSLDSLLERGDRELRAAKAARS